MTETFRKLYFKSQSPVLVLHAPRSFANEVSAMKRETDLNRDTLSGGLAGMGFDTVRQIAIDEDWSALRFRVGLSR
jgi:hypothetical protein